MSWVEFNFTYDIRCPTYNFVGNMDDGGHDDDDAGGGGDNDDDDDDDRGLYYLVYLSHASSRYFFVDVFDLRNDFDTAHLTLWAIVKRHKLQPLK